MRVITLDLPDISQVHGETRLGLEILSRHFNATFNDMSVNYERARSRIEDGSASPLHPNT